MLLLCAKQHIDFLSQWSNAMNDISDKYTKFVRPEFGQLLKLLGIDKSFHRAEGDYLYYLDDDGNEQQVTDFIGGFGTSFFGHNNPDLVNTAIRNLTEKTTFNGQISCRATSALLAEKLNELTNRYTGKNYVTSFANSGAEAVELALKHSAFSHSKKIDKIRSSAEQQAFMLKTLLTKTTKASMLNKAQITSDSESILKDHGVSLAAMSTINFDELVSQVARINKHKFSTPPAYLSLKGAFHGKTSGALQLTFNEDFRLPFSNISQLNVTFIEPGNQQALIEAFSLANITYLTINITDDGKVSVDENRFCNIAAMFIEPILGEGGIKIIDKKFLHNCRNITQQHDVPLVFDEIQTGMGRTGTFLYAEQLDITADYYLLSKSLGGGLAKISAMLVEEETYVNEFSLISSSTYAEDDHSAAISLSAIKLLEHDEKIIENLHARSEQLISGLNTAKAKHPDLIKEVRGKGLLIGLEFCKHGVSSTVGLQRMSEAEDLVPMIGAYLFHEHKIRVAPTLSNAFTIRVEPSAFVSEQACEQFISAIYRVCEILQKNNIYELIKCTLGLPATPINAEIPSFPNNRIMPSKHEGARNVAFIAHLVDATDMARPETDLSLTQLTDEQMNQFVQRYYTVSSPFLFQQMPIKSATGEVVNMHIIGLFFDSKIIGMHMALGDPAIIKDLIDKGIEHAESLDCEVIGFGGFNSIITKNCEDLKATPAALTTGNSLTVGMGVKALLTEADKVGIDLTQSCFAAVGAGGNICSIYSEIMAEHVPNIILIGRAGKESRLISVAADIYASAYQEILQSISQRQQASETSNTLSTDLEIHSQLEGVAGKILNTHTVSQLLKDTSVSHDQIGHWLYNTLVDELGCNAPIKISTDISDTQHANLIISASNSIEPVIHPSMLGEGPIVICDIAVPLDVAPSVTETRNDVHVIQGGTVSFSNEPDLNVPGFRLDKGQVFACFTETATMGFEGITESYSVGRISKQKVKKIVHIAERHGVQLGGNRVVSTY